MFTYPNAFVMSTETDQFIENHPIVKIVLPYAVQAVQKAFGGNTKVELEVTTDRESTGNYEQLFAYICYTCESDYALALLDKIDEWYDKLPSAVQDLFNFNLR